MIIENLKHVKNLTYTEEILRDFIIENPEEIMKISATKLAQECHVAISSVSRLVQKLGYEKFSDFKIEFAKSYQTLIETAALSKVKPFSQSTTMAEVINRFPILYQRAIGFTQEHLKDEELAAIVEKMLGATVLIYGTGMNFSLAQIAEYKLEELGIHCKAQDSLHDQLVDLLGYTNQKTFAIFLTHSGNNRAVLKAAQRVHHNGIPSLLISAADKEGKIQQYVDQQIAIIPTKNTGDFSSTLWSMSIQYILDVLVAGVYVKKIDLISDIAEAYHYYPKER
ncbi:MurR/RpiR family transcriptional regulator [Enterococcus sp. LJL90]